MKNSLRTWGLSITTDVFARTVLAVLLSFSLTLPAFSQDDNTLDSTPPRPAPKKQQEEHKPRKAPMKQIKDIERNFKRTIKKTSPNPKVEKPSQSPLPPNAPMMPKAPEAPPLPPRPTASERFFSGAAKVMTKSWGPNIFVWLPAISTDPNSGPTIGIMPVLVLADDANRHIRHLLAPSYTWNQLFGQTGTFRYYWYPTDASQLYTVASFSEHTNREYKGRYENPSLMDGILYFRAEMYYDVDASYRFFGLGPESRESNESGYTGKDTSGNFKVGMNFYNSWRAIIGQRFRRMETQASIIPNIPDISTQFPTTPGIGANKTAASELRLLFDTRDIPITPSVGSSGEAFVEKTSQALGSDADFIRYGLEGKRLFPWENPKHITVIHSVYEQANGPNLPFYELPSLGGRESLRGFGDGRFVDRGRFALNLEHRIRMASIALMGIQTNFEVAPFVDLGTVFPTLQDIQSKDFHPVFGGAFRAAVKPNVVGDVEVGVGKEGVAVFVDINYPF